MDRIDYVEMNEDHLSEVRAIYNYYVVNTTITFSTEVITLDETREMVMNNNPRYQSFMIKNSHTTLGYVLITQYKKRQAFHITAEVAIYLKPEHRGRGVGGAALEFIEDIAIRQGFHSLVASICTENERSEKLFASRGYIRNAHFKEIGYKFDRFLDLACYQKMIGKDQSNDHLN